MSSILLPNFYRQRFLLQFIDFAGGTISKLDLQKLLFLAHQRVNVNYFDFVPYYYGSYSFQAASDLELLEKSGWIKTMKNDIVLQHSADRFEFVKEGERTEMHKFFSEYKELRGNNLIKYVYEQFPYYTINSRIAFKFKCKNQYTKKSGDGETLYTVGYEGISFEEYVNKLIKNDVNVLCDVRKNPLSRKFGFSKGVMSKLLPRLNISYVHIPELGIVSSQRKNLCLPADYARLFEAYCNSLPSKAEYVDIILDFVKGKKNVALTCFEHEAELCHRSRIGRFMEKKYSLKIIHL